ncbi:accessory gene regulator B family protein [Paenibacillus sp. NPDC058071]|uniref:accessory gene regulator B family protein n=1 Tax=Paenibacillus sp. NPDC058071 TaxID=3346326 RepID=UPI0036DE8860
MTFVEKISERIAISIHRSTPNASSVAVLRYSLINLINLWIFMAIVLLISAFTGHFTGALLSIIAFPLTRYFSGGMHFKSMNVCNIVSSVLVLISIYLPIHFWYTGFVINTLALLILVITAPANVTRSKLEKKHYPILKVIVALIVSSNYLFNSEILALVFFIQALTTIPVWQKLLDKYQI